MASEEYREAKGEFINCLVMGPICLFVSWILAFTEWWPIMKADKQKEAARPAE